VVAHGGGPGRELDETEERLHAVTGLAEQHLPWAAARDFVDLLGPALRMFHAAEGDPLLARLGGLPTLGAAAWPVWEGHGPLSHVLSLDCAPVADRLPELGTPREGRLGFFYFDGHYDDFASFVGTWDPSTTPGFRVLHRQACAP
jgi:hypothetical protein